jgi:hypothetical protein
MTARWLRHEEAVAALSGVVDVGVGQDAVRRTGLSGLHLSRLACAQFHEVPDGGAAGLLVRARSGGKRAQAPGED